MQSTDIKNIANHIGYVLDMSWSMRKHADALIKVADQEIAWMATRSKEMEQETRVSVWVFNDPHHIKCLIWDMDVLRVPSIAGLYNPDGNTALIDATILAINDLKMTPEKYGQHSFLLYVLTDGEENRSRQRSSTLTALVKGLASNWTFAAFVPDQRGAQFAENCGFPAANIQIWETSSSQGIDAVASHIREANETFFQARSMGQSSVSSLYRVNTVTEGDLRGLYPLTPGSYKIGKVPEDMQIAVFVAGEMGRFQVGKSFYRLAKAETVQDYKEVAVRTQDGLVYLDSSIRVKLGLPPLAPARSGGRSRVRPAIAGLEVFIQSTSHNRKLIGGTEVLMLR